MAIDASTNHLLTFMLAGQTKQLWRGIKPCDFHSSILA